MSVNVLNVPNLNTEVYMSNSENDTQPFTFIIHYCFSLIVKNQNETPLYWEFYE